MKTFGEVINRKNETTNSALPSFREVLEGEGKTSCMSESMCEKLNEMCESMCSEMKSCHEDESERTAENYRAECEGKIKEMYESISKACNECMK
jgi:hypothetical protein